MRCTLSFRVRVLVLTMTPDGGAMGPALEMLGFKPYTLRNSFQRGNASSHPTEWAAVLDGKKKFDPVVLLKNDFDSLVGPPAAIRFDRVLQGCPAFTRVVLVEEPDKEAWAADVSQFYDPLLATTAKVGKRSIGKSFHRMLEAMLPSDKKLGRVGALELYEERVKQTVPAGRLLVYRIGDGWEPLCKFLNCAVPVSRIEDDAVKPFPQTGPSANGFQICEDLQHRLSRAESMYRYLLVVAILISGYTLWPLLEALRTPLVEYYRDFRAAFASEKMEGDDKPMSLRQAMIKSKEVTLNFEKKVRNEGLDIRFGSADNSSGAGKS